MKNWCSHFESEKQKEKKHDPATQKATLPEHWGQYFQKTSVTYSMDVNYVPPEFTPIFNTIEIRLDAEQGKVLEPYYRSFLNLWWAMYLVHSKTEKS